MTGRVLVGWLLAVVAVAGFVAILYPVALAVAAVVGRLTGAGQ